MQADYVIIGSGSAGSTMAYRLGEAGKRVIVIEQGGSDAGQRPKRQKPVRVAHFPPWPGLRLAIEMRRNPGLPLQPRPGRHAFRPDQVAHHRIMVTVRHAQG